MKHPIHDNFYAKRDGSPYSAPLANRGPEALQHLLVDRLDLVAAQLRLLDRTELVALATAAEQLARIARATAREFWPKHAEPGPGGGWSDRPCASCGRRVRVWNGPNGQRVLLDPDPAGDGDTVILDAKPVSVIREDVAGRFTLYRSHFFTCPNRLVTDPEGAAQ